jgi:hypothetical protein
MNVTFASTDGFVPTCSIFIDVAKCFSNYVRIKHLTFQEECCFYEQPILQTFSASRRRENLQVFWFAILQSKNSPPLESSCRSLSIQIFRYFKSCRMVSVVSDDRATSISRFWQSVVLATWRNFQMICVIINWNSACFLSCICGLFDEDFSNIECTAPVDRAVVNLSFACQWILVPNDFKLCFCCIKACVFCMCLETV